MDNITGNTETEVTKIKLPNLRHMAFIREYLKTKNGTEAYCKVYPGVSRKNARIYASDLLALPNIKAEIDAIKAEIKEKYKVEYEDLIAQLQHIATNTITASPNISISALREMGKLAGLYVEKKDITSGGERISINLDLKDE
jgi:hypothetical protein